MSVTIKIKEAHDLPHSNDLISKNDPYCVVSYGSCSRKTRVMKNAGNSVVWSEEFYLPYVVNEHISFHVYDRDRFTSDDHLCSGVLVEESFILGQFIGRVNLFTKNHSNGGYIEIDLKLNGVKAPTPAVQQQATPQPVVQPAVQQTPMQQPVMQQPMMAQQPMIHQQAIMFQPQVSPGQFLMPQQPMYQQGIVYAQNPQQMVYLQQPQFMPQQSQQFVNQFFVPPTFPQQFVATQPMYSVAPQGNVVFSPPQNLMYPPPQQQQQQNNNH
jgi:C2 domain